MSVEVDRLVWGGDGLGRSGGKVWFVPLTAPGDLVSAEVLTDRGSFGRGRMLELLRPGPDRVEPRCPLFGECGGCQWQHLGYDSQVAAKGKILGDALGRIGKIDVPETAAVAPSPLTFGYRHRTRLHACAVKSKVRIGFFRPGSHEIVPLEECPVLQGSLNRVLKIFSEKVRGTLAAAGGTVVVSLASDVGGKKVTLSLRSRRGPVASGTDVEEAVAAAGEDGIALEVTDGPCSPLVLGKGPLALETSGDAFTQVNLSQNEHLAAAVTALLAPSPGESVLDLYCGIGNYSIPAAAAGAEVTGIDLNRASVRCARSNAARLGLEGLSFRQGKADEWARSLVRKGRRFDAVVINPPRTGCRETVGQLPPLQAGRIVMVSCDPPTFARDAALLSAGGYRLAALQAFDLFPQTFHFETVGLFVR